MSSVSESHESGIPAQTNVGTITREDSCVNTFVWKVPKFFNLAEKVDQYIESPNFTFFGIPWCLKLYPYGETAYKSDGWIGFYLMNRSVSQEAYTFKYILGLKTADGTNYITVSSESTIPLRKFWGRAKFVQRVTLWVMPGKLETKGTLTFFCTLQTEVSTSKEAASQCKQNEGIERLIQNFKELLQGDDADVLLRVKDKEFKAHKAILKVRSPVFRSLFTYNMKENNSGNVDIMDCNPAVFDDFLHFLYCGTVTDFSVDSVFDLYFVADKYDVADLRAMCVDFIMNNISKDTFFNALTLALRHNESMLLGQATTFFIENGIQIIESVEWLSFQKQNLVAANELVLKLLKSKHSN